MRGCGHVSQFVEEEPVALLAASHWELRTLTLALYSGDPDSSRALLWVHWAILGGSLCAGRGELLCESSFNVQFFRTWRMGWSGQPKVGTAKLHSHL